MRTQEREREREREREKERGRETDRELRVYIYILGFIVFKESSVYIIKCSSSTLTLKLTLLEVVLKKSEKKN